MCQQGCTTSSAFEMAPSLSVFGWNALFFFQSTFDRIKDLITFEQSLRSPGLPRWPRRGCYICGPMRAGRWPGGRSAGGPTQIKTGATFSFQTAGLGVFWVLARGANPPMADERQRVALVIPGLPNMPHIVKGEFEATMDALEEYLRPVPQLAAEHWFIF
jgi:hypothetical protein